MIASVRKVKILKARQLNNTFLLVGPSNFFVYWFRPRRNVQKLTFLLNVENNSHPFSSQTFRLHCMMRLSSFCLATIPIVSLTISFPNDSALLCPTTLNCSLLQQLFWCKIYSSRELLCAFRIIWLLHTFIHAL